MNVSELHPNTYNSYYQPYINKLADVELLALLQKQVDNFPKFIESIPNQKWKYAYHAGKWTIVEVLLHIIDAERIFQYRALRFARQDDTPLPGFDQDLYVPNSNSAHREKNDVIREYIAVRQSTIALFASFLDEDLKRIGMASDSEMSVAALGFIICGHQKHHRDVIRERYL
ncbi:DinB family protein [Costertonia aggregata]|uniref:DinB family protein n=1 Tax=Costertonia aggregata TaxID=343403 RepID=A0A7H9AUF7_9FLAO|nr:DinB family protein [Costertonia aggregata]QLG47074.1 DinB family protein [Costertonia aggregata]